MGDAKLRVEGTGDGVDRVSVLVATGTVGVDVENATTVLVALDGAVIVAVEEAVGTGVDEAVATAVDEIVGIAVGVSVDVGGGTEVDVVVNVAVA